MRSPSGRTAAMVLCVQAALATGCRVTATFVCERHEQCRSADGSGLCETNGFCSFADNACPSGRRYDDGAGQYAGVCTAVQQPPDAAIDAFSPAACPASYGVTVAGSSSRYRGIALATFWEQHAACNADLPGATHLVILDSLAEADGIRQQLPIAHGGNIYYAGVVQDPSSLTPSAGWINLDGTPVDSALWASGAPDDGNGIESDHAYQVAYFYPLDPYLHDYSGAAIAAICECDGKPVAAIAQQYIDADPRNPN